MILRNKLFLLIIFKVLLIFISYFYLEKVKIQKIVFQDTYYLLKNSNSFFRLFAILVILPAPRKIITTPVSLRIRYVICSSGRSASQPFALVMADSGSESGEPRKAHLHEPESHFPPNWQIIWILIWAGQDHIPPPMNPVTSTYSSQKGQYGCNMDPIAIYTKLLQYYYYYHYYYYCYYYYYYYYYY